MGKRQKYFENKGLLYWGISMLLNVLWVFLVFFSIDDNQLSIYFSSENLYLPTVFKDVFVDKAGFSGWQLYSAPNFFPDMLVFFVFNSIFGNFKLAMILYSCFQYTFLLFLINLLLKHISNNISFNYLAFANLLVLLFLFATTVSGDFSFTANLLSIGQYMGTFIMSLLCVLLLIKFIRNGNKKNLLLLFIFGLLAIISNRFFIVMFVLPSLTLLLFVSNEKYNKQIIKAVAAILFMTISGLIIHASVKWFNIFSYTQAEFKLFGASNIAYSFKVMAAQHLIYLHQMRVHFVIAVLSLSSLILLGYIANKYYKKIFIKKERNYNIIKAYYLMFSVSFILLVFFMPVFIGGYENWHYLKCNIHVFYFAIFNSSFIIYYFIRANKKKGPYIFRKSFYVILSVIIIYTFYFGVKKDIGNGMSRFMSYYPEEVFCIDSIAVENDLQYGVADYSIASKVLMFSKNNIRVYPIKPDMSIANKPLNTNWYYKTGKGRPDKPRFNFVIINLAENEIMGNIPIEPINIHYCNRILKVLQVQEFSFDR